MSQRQVPGIGIIWAAILALWIPNIGHAEEAGGAYPWSGLPALQRFAPGERPGGQQSFAVAQTQQGEILVANADGVLRYFGGRWSDLKLPVLNTARSLAVAPNGNVYVGGYHHFGQLMRAPDGQYFLEDLDDLFFPDHRGAPLAEIWETITDPSAVYFGTNSDLFRIGYDGTQARWKIGEGISAASYRVGDEIWVRREGGQLLALRDDELTVLLEETPRTVWIGKPAGSEQVLLLLQDGRFQSLDGGQLQPLQSPVSAALGPSAPYCVLALDDGSLLVGTLSGEVYWINPDLTLKQRWPISAFPILSMAKDSENGLWLATDHELVRMDLSPQWSLLSPDRGYRGTLLDGGVYDGEILLATSLGLYTDLGGGKLRLLGEEGRETRDLQAIPGGALVATGFGIFQRSADQLEQIADDANVIYISASKRHPDVVFAIEDAGLLILAADGQRWGEVDRVIDPAYRFLSLTEDDGGYLWAGQVSDDPMRIRLSDDGRNVIEASRQGAGLERTAGADSVTFGYRGQVYAATDEGTYRWAGDRFIADSVDGLERLAAQRLTELTVVECGAEEIYAGTTRQLYRRVADGWQPLPPMDGQAQGIAAFNCGKDDERFITTWAGLARYNANGRAGPISAPTPVMESVEVSQGQDRDRLHLQPVQTPRIAAGSTLRLSYALPTFDRGWQLQSRLHPQDAYWSDDPGLGLREFSAQSPGEFVFQVRATRDQQPTGALLTYRFIVVPRWWQSGWAGLGFAALLVGLIALLVRWRLSALAQQNRQLESVVAERTASLQARSIDLQAANQRLRTLADQDGLTGVANRRRLESDLDQAFALAVAEDSSLALLMVDLDHFKQFNDRYGHLRGDDELRRAAQQMQSALNWPGGLLARWGGEEFVVMLPKADLSQALAQAASIRAALAHTEGDQQRLTVSIGVAERRSQAAADANTLLDQADQALYAAKRAGRDRVEIYKR